MEEKKGFGETLNAFFAGKGFYIVLLLCAGLIATSIWLMASGSGADVEASSGEETRIAAAAAKPEESTASPAGNETEETSSSLRRRLESIPVMETEETILSETPAEAPEIREPAAQTEPATAQESMEPAAVTPVDYFIWPVNGPVVRDYSTEVLSYDRTMADWRTHGGVDVGAAPGAEVLAVNNGTVSAVYRDEMLGTVVEIDHGSGLVSVYANLDSAPAVQPGERVSVGSPVGAVGATALGEIGEESHLHFAMRQDGQEVDPSDWLPER